MGHPEADPAALARAYIEAVGEKRLDDVAGVLHPELELTLGGVSHDKEQYLGALRRLGAILDRNEVTRVFVDGSDVCVVYDFVTGTPVGAARSVELLAVDDGLTREVELIFERERWPESSRS